MALCTGRYVQSLATSRCWDGRVPFISGRFHLSLSLNLPGRSDMFEGSEYRRREWQNTTDKRRGGTGRTGVRDWHTRIVEKVCPPWSTTDWVHPAIGMGAGKQHPSFQPIEPEAYPRCNEWRGSVLGRVMEDISFSFLSTQTGYVSCAQQLAKRKCIITV